jgi:hypothetical protein
MYCRVDTDGERSSAGPASAGSLAGALHIGSNYAADRFINGRESLVCMRKTTLTHEERSDAQRYIVEKFGTPSYANTKEFLWVGDSITACSTPGAAQWRERVRTQAAARTDGVDFYRINGPVTPSSVASVFDRCLAGGGVTTVSMRALLSTHGIGTRYVPDIVPIMLGTNDFGVLGSSVAQLLTDYRALMADLFARLPGARFVLMKIMPRSDNPTAQAKIVDWNTNEHDTFVLECAGLGMDVISDDTFATLTGLVYLDGLHLAAASTDVMGDAMEVRARVWAGVPA